MQPLVSFGLTALGGVSTATAVVAPVVSAIKQSEVDEAIEDKTKAENERDAAKTAKDEAEAKARKAEEDKTKAEAVRNEFNRKLQQKPMDVTEDELIKYFKARRSELMDRARLPIPQEAKCFTQTERADDTFWACFRFKNK